MIYELKKEAFINILPLLEEENTNLEILSVVKGFTPGWIFVDSIDYPTTAMIWSKGIQGFYFTGSARNKAFNSVLNTYIDKVITPRMLALDMTHFEFSGTSKDWSRTFDEIFYNRELDLGRQFVYKKLLTARQKGRVDLPCSYQLMDTHTILKSKDNYKVDFLLANILEWWEDVDSFFEDGIGYCIIFESEVVCSCVTSFMDGKEMESHIETHESHQRKGLASAAVFAFINKAHELSYSLYWDCMEKNTGSRALAEKFKYNKVFEYPLYDFKLMPLG